MPGFGQGPFGDSGFGDWKWSRQVLYDFLPAIYKEEDATNHGRVLESYTDGLRPSFEGLRNRIREYDFLRDPLLVRAESNEYSIVRLGKNRPVRGVVEQRGIDGKVEVGTLRFTAPSARFSSLDIGKELILVDAAISSNRRPVKIASIISVQTVTTTPVLTTESGPLRWELRAFTADVNYSILEVQSGDVSYVTPGWLLTDGIGSFEVLSRRQLGVVDSEARLLTEREGFDGTILATGFFSAPSANFSSQDVGKKLTISGFTTEPVTRKIEIARVVSSTTISPSSVLIRGSDSNGGVIYANRGAVEDKVEVEHVAAGLSTSLAVTTLGNRVSVALGTNGSGEVISSAASVVSAVNADVDASVLLFASVDFAGTGVAGVSEPVEVKGALLTQEAGSFDWAVLPRPELRTRTRGLPRGVVEQEGTDLQVIVKAQSSIVQSSSSDISPSTLGKTLLIRGSTQGNDGLYSIDSVLSTTSFTVEGVLNLESALYWEIRDPTAVGDLTEVKLTAPLILPFLAQDFGIEAERAQTEARQRAHVAHITKWINKKGNSESYRILGLLDGFDVETTQLYRVGADLYSAIPSDNAYQVGEFEPGRIGSDGQLLAGSPGRVRFRALTAAFEPTDVGLQIQVQNAATASNNKFYTIDLLLDDQTVEFRLVDTATVPDANNGALVWGITRLYTDLGPFLPLMDEFNSDALEEYIEDRWGSGRFSVDRFCWESTFTTQMDTHILSVTSATPVNHTVSVSTSPFPLADIVTIIPDPGTGIRPPLFRLTDSSGTSFFMESYPVSTGLTTASFEVIATQAPAIGAATLAYVCSPQDFGCDYCASSVALAKIQAGSVAQDPFIDPADLLERTFLRLETEVRPAHVSLISQFQQTLTASLHLSASGLGDVVTVVNSGGQIQNIVLSGVWALCSSATVSQLGSALLVGTATLTASATLTQSNTSTMLATATLVVDGLAFRNCA